MKANFINSGYHGFARENYTKRRKEMSYLLFCKTSIILENNIVALTRIEC